MWAVEVLIEAKFKQSLEAEKHEVCLGNRERLEGWLDWILEPWGKY